MMSDSIPSRDEALGLDLDQGNVARSHLDQLNQELDEEVKTALAERIARFEQVEFPPRHSYVDAEIIENLREVLAAQGLDAGVVPIGPPTSRNATTADVDLALNTATAAKKAGLHPVRAAEAVVEELAEESTIELVDSMGPFVNIRLNFDVVAPRIIDQVQELGARYGQFSNGDAELVIVDYSSPNVAKNMTVAHLRSTIIGQTIMNLQEATGNAVFGVNHIGDWGSQFGGILYEFQQNFERDGDAFLERLEENPAKVLMSIYRDFNERVKSDPVAAEGARELFGRLEAGEPDLVKLWAQFREWSVSDFLPVYERLGISFDAIQGESFYEGRMDEAVQEAIDAGVLETAEDGTIVLPSQPLIDPRTGKTNTRVMLGKGSVPKDEIVVKPDGGTVYLTRDIAALKYRTEELGATKVYYVIGKEQQVHCWKMFAIAAGTGTMELGDAQHVSFGHLNIDGRKMKSREGKVVLLNDLLDEAVSAAAEYMVSKSDAESVADLSEEELETARQIGVGAVMFNDLRQDRVSDIEFNPDIKHSIESGGSVYIQYTHARMTRLIEGIEPQGEELHVPTDLSQNEKEILLALARFPQVVETAAAESKPHIVATYLTELCRSANHFYRDTPVAKAPEGPDKQFRASLVAATLQVVRNAAALINLELPEKI